MKKAFLKNITYCIVLCLSTSCIPNPDEGACGSGKGSFKVATPEMISTFPKFTGNDLNSEIIYYNYPGGSPPKVQFIIGNVLDQICTEEHLSIQYTYYLTKQTQPLPLKIFGEAFWGVFIGQDKIIMADGIVFPEQKLENSRLNLGLKQVFPAGAATVRIFLTVEFDAHSTQQEDFSYFIDHVKHLEIFSSYSKF